MVDRYLEVVSHDEGEELVLDLDRISWILLDKIFKSSVHRPNMFLQESLDVRTHVYVRKLPRRLKPLQPLHLWNIRRFDMTGWRLNIEHISRAGANYANWFDWWVGHTFCIIKSSNTKHSKDEILSIERFNEPNKGHLSLVSTEQHVMRWRVSTFVDTLVTT